MISQSSTVVAVQEQVSSDLAEESVILNLKSGVYYGLNPVGAWIWTQIQHPQTVRSLKEGMLEKYNVEPEICERDLLALLENLVSAELIEVQDEATA